jgi:hypothetical protein
MRRSPLLTLAFWSAFFILALGACEIIDDLSDAQDAVGGADTTEQYCIADQWCDPDCQYDPDCGSAPDCTSDSWCNPDCATGNDPDCQSECSCDYNEFCEAAAKGSSSTCTCDTDCAGGKSACSADYHCDTFCPTGVDPDCVEECSCDNTDGVCEPATKNDPAMTPCDCDDDCVLSEPCDIDGHCDTWCPAGEDPDC